MLNVVQETVEPREIYELLKKRRFRDAHPQNDEDWIDTDDQLVYVGAGEPDYGPDERTEFLASFKNWKGRKGKVLLWFPMPPNEFGYCTEFAELPFFLSTTLSFNDVLAFENVLPGTQFSITVSDDAAKGGERVVYESSLKELLGKVGMTQDVAGEVLESETSQGTHVARFTIPDDQRLIIPTMDRYQPAQTYIDQLPPDTAVQVEAYGRINEDTHLWDCVLPPAMLDAVGEHWQNLDKFVEIHTVAVLSR